MRRGTPEPHHADAYAPLYPADQCVFKEGREPWARHGASRYVLPLKVTPAMRPGVTDRLWEMNDLVDARDAFETSRKRALSWLSPALSHVRTGAA